MQPSAEPSGVVANPSATTTFGLDGDMTEIATHVGLTLGSYSITRDVATKTVTVVLTGK